MTALDDLERIRTRRVELLEQLLKEHDRNPSWIAKHLGITRAGAHRYMKGANIPEENVAKICDLFDKPLSFLHNPNDVAAATIDWDVVSEVFGKVASQGERSADEKKSMYALLYSTLVELKG